MYCKLFLLYILGSLYLRVALIDLGLEAYISNLISIILRKRIWFTRFNGGLKFPLLLTVYYSKTSVLIKTQDPMEYVTLIVYDMRLTHVIYLVSTFHYKRCLNKKMLG